MRGVTRDGGESYDWTLSYSVRNSSPKSYSAVLPLMVRHSPRTDALESYSITLSMKPWLLELNVRDSRFSFSACDIECCPYVPNALTRTLNQAPHKNPWRYAYFYGLTLDRHVSTVHT